MSNKHRVGGIFDPAEEPAMGQELTLFKRIKAALQVPTAPECIDGFTDRELSSLSRHIAVRLTRFGK